ncbi:hypothetical protein ACFY1P_32415 [Streptomyces sp. NPDC001407]|uniref:hypothetical protein n=1 Tax=Streptomyces sp. NPDC001407 TaxID=3364573 RepID=UPI0036C77F5C
MDQGELRRMVRDAVAAGVLDPATTMKFGQECSVESGPVATSSLFHMYRRRLRKARDDDSLQRETLKLVEFLQGYTEEFLSMISVRPAAGGFYLILADSAESRALFWMKMFDQDY